MAILALSLVVQPVAAQTATVDLPLSGVVYSDEHRPYDRLDKAIQVMQAADITVVQMVKSSCF